MSSKSNQEQKVKAPKPCPYCKSGLNPDYKRVKELEQFLDEEGRIAPRRRTHVCAKHQRSLKRAIENARKIALLPIPGAD